jgi:hypothetical protein
MTTSVAVEKRRIYKSGFRFLRTDRQSAFCPPSANAQLIGWHILSPVDVLLSPINEVQFQASEEEAKAIASQAGFNYLWQRDGVYIGVTTAIPLRLFDYKTSEGSEAMFILNGEGTLEWRLGFQVLPPVGCGVLILDDPSFPKDLCIPGFMSYENLLSLNSKGGLSIAIKPTRSASIKRGDIIARLLLMPSDTVDLNMSARFKR